MDSATSFSIGDHSSDFCVKYFFRVLSYQLDLVTTDRGIL